MLDRAELIRMRGDVVEKTIEIEDLISEILTRHYFGTLFESARPFMREFVKHEGVSFGLKTMILESVFKRWQDGQVAITIGLPETVNLNDVKGHLRGIGQMRNLFAHREAAHADFKGDPKKLHDDFMDLHKKTKAELEIIIDRFAKRYPSGLPNV